jgi:hypothetical protein
VKTLDCKFSIFHGQKFKLLLTLFFVVVLVRGHLGITTFQHILQDPRTRNIPLILRTPNFGQPKKVWGKEIEVLRALTNTPPSIKSEDLQSLVHEIESAVDEAKSKSLKRKRVMKSREPKNSVVGESVESYETCEQNDEILPDLTAEWQSPDNSQLEWKPKYGKMWQGYLT